MEGILIFSFRIISFLSGGAMGKIDMTPERLDALETAIDAVVKWINSDRSINSTDHPLERTIPILEEMILDAEDSGIDIFKESSEAPWNLR
jgi:hypothetical protein